MLSPDLLYLSSDRQFVLFSVAALQEEIDVAKLRQLLAFSEFKNYQPSESGIRLQSVDQGSKQASARCRTIAIRCPVLGDHSG